MAETGKVPMTQAGGQRDDWPVPLSQLTFFDHT